MEASQTAQAMPITERLRNIKIGSYTVDHGSHTKHIAVRAICEEAAAEIERLRKLDIELRGECVLLADVLRDAFEVVKTIEGEEQDECDRLTGLCLSMAHALALYDERRIAPPNVKVAFDEVVRIGKDLSEQLATVTAERDELVGALKQFAECDLNDDNCVSLEVATRRIRSLAQAALAKLSADKGEQHE